MNHKTIKQTLTCDLTDKERREYGINLATTLADYEALETEKKQNADHYKDRLAGLQAHADELARKVRDGKEWRDVECRVYYGQPDKEHKQTVRLDTMEVVKTERMTEVDLQLVMPLEEEEDSADNFDGATVDVEGEDSLGAAVKDFHAKVNGLPMPEDDGGIEPETEADANY
jgi:hypothetical protein